MQPPVPSFESADPDRRLERVLTRFVGRVVSVRLSDDGAPVERTAYALLGSLHDDGPQRLSALAEVVLLDRSTVSRQLTALEHRGLVQRRPHGGGAEPDRAQLAELLERLDRDMFPHAADEVAPPVPEVASTAHSRVHHCTGHQQERR